MRRVSVLLCCLSLSLAAHAAPVVHGVLSSDSSGTVITDNISGREYLRLDQFNLTYADTLVAVSPGGIYEGWSIADREVAEIFIDSMLGYTSLCNGLGFQGICGTASGWNDGDFGGNTTSGQPIDSDTFAYLSDAGIYTFGSVAIRDDGVIFKQESWGNVDTLDFWGHVTSQQINLLLYRDPVADTDGDGVVNAQDNCPVIPNPDQMPSAIDPARGVACESLPPGC